MNIDKLNHTSPKEAMQTAYAVIDRLQDSPAHLQVAAMAIVFQEMAAVLRLSVSELLNKADRITRDLNEHYQPEIKALREYIKQEVSK